MRILLSTETFSPAMDSITRTTRYIADGLIDAGHEAVILTSGTGLSDYRGARVLRTRPMDPTGTQVKQYLLSHSPDLNLVCSPGVVGRKVLKHGRGLGIGSVVVEQSPLFHQVADYWRSRVADRTDRVLVTSRWMVERAQELGVDADLWHPGVDTETFHPGLRDQWLHSSWSRRGSRVVVGYVGGLHKRHGVRRLPELQSIHGTRVVVIGEGSQRAWLESRMPGAKFTGHLSTGDLSVAMASLDVLVHPGEHETCSLALREASASGVPIVAPKSGGATDVVRHLESGLLYAPGSKHELVKACDAVVTDRFRSLLGDRGRELATSRTWAHATAELQRTLQTTREAHSIAAG